MREKLKILFLCTGNSCRSQMAEGWAGKLKKDIIDAYSAGIETHGLNPNAVKVMAEAGRERAKNSNWIVTGKSGIRSRHLLKICLKILATELYSQTKEKWEMENDRKMTGIFERYLTVWVGLCIAGGILLGKIAPNLAETLDGMSISVNGASVVSIPIAVCLFFMMYPIMVKIDFASVIKAGKSGKPVFLTLFINWCIKPFTMYAISLFFLGFVLKSFIGTGAVDLVKIPFGLDLPAGATHGAGVVVLQDGIKLLQIPLWRSYFAGCILLGIAPCTAMVLVWSYLSRGDDGLTLVMVALNSLTMLVLYGVLGGFLLGVGKLPIPWQALVLSVGIYVALPLVTGYFSRKWIISSKGETWFKEKFLGVLTPVTISALLLTLVLLFSFKGEVITANPLTIFWIAIPLFIQAILIFALGYAAAKFLKLKYEYAAPAAMIGASNHFEVAIATAVMLFGLSSGAALATVVGVLIEVPVMLMLVGFCKKTTHWFNT